MKILPGDEPYAKEKTYFYRYRFNATKLLHSAIAAENNDDEKECPSTSPSCLKKTRKTLTDPPCHTRK